ncbi:MAG TPA: response regulator transcription factor [Gaiellaceae bacterium]|jgi:DNA-binding NarL/FixJ family response regulator|nr:response regulator transcription factor [Gaiellaceae bacterium]
MKILITNDRPLLIAGAREVLARDGDFEVVGVANHGAELMELIAARHPDVILLDLGTPGLEGLASVDRIRTAYPSVAVVVLSDVTDPVEIRAAVRHGASGVVFTTIDPRDLGTAIRNAVQHTAFHTIAPPPLDHDSAQTLDLSPRELEVLEAVATGLSNREIAMKLWVSEPTVKFHLTNVYRKLRVTNRTQATRWLLDRERRAGTV